MSLWLPWLIFPLVMLVLCLGCGLLVDRISGRIVAGALLAPVGLAAVIVIAGLLTMQSTSARFATPVCAAAALIGLVSGRERLRNATPNRWLIAAGLGVFLAYGAPVLMTGSATFAGYIKLDDTATWLALTDRVMDHGRSLSGIAPSTHFATLDYTLARGYPLGSLLPWGVGRALVGQDLAWLIQPYLAFLAALFALTAWTLLVPLVRRPYAAAVATFIASQPALLYAYSLWGGIKELTAALCIALAAALVPGLVKARGNPLRRVIPLAVPCAATLATLTLGGALWIVVALLGALALFAAGNGRRTTLAAAAAFAAVGALLALPAIKTASYLFNSNDGLTEQGAASGGAGASADQIATALGNLVRPLSTLQLIGIWPVADFRTDTGAPAIAHILMAIAATAAAAGLVLAYQRRAWSLLLYVATTAAGCAVITHYGSPWVDAKALATASPLVLVTAAAAIGALLERAHWAIPMTLAALIGGGVIWSNALAYGGTSLAPRGQLHELQQIGNRIAGQGPTLMTEYQPYGARHFLRRADAEAASELRVRPDVLTHGTTLPKGAFADVDEFLLTSLLDYKTLVLRRSPAGSRPPSSFKLVSQGRWYDVWQRDPLAPAVLRHIGLGNPVQPTGIAPCSDVMALAKEAGPQGRLATVFRSPVVVVDLNTFTHPLAWTDPAGADLLPGSEGSATGQLYIANPGAYELWIGGSVRSRLEARVDGSTVGSMRDQLNVSGQWSDYGPVTIGPGNHAIELRASGPDLSPGSAGLAPPLGPLALTLTSAAPAVSYLATSDARSLCGKNLDWLEAVH